MSVLDRNAASCHTTTTRPSAATSAGGTGGARSRPTSESSSSAIRAGGAEGGAAVARDRGDDRPGLAPAEEDHHQRPVRLDRRHREHALPAVTAGRQVVPPSGLVCTASTSRRTSVYPR